MVNLNKMAQVIAAKETGNVQVDIAQIKEIIKIFLIELSKLEDADLIALVDRFYEK